MNTSLTYWASRSPLETCLTYFSVNYGYLVSTVVVIALVSYLITVHRQRYKNLEYIRKKYPDPNQILNDTAAAVEVLAITGQKEFPSMFKTYTTPKTSKILVSTGEFEKECPRRYEDTELILREFADVHGRIQNHLKDHPDTPNEHVLGQLDRKEKAIKRLNELHGKYNIGNDDFLYTLTMFITEPVAWACYHAWYVIGLEMNMKDIPESFEKVIQFKEEHAKKHIRYAKVNWMCGEPTLRLFITFLPSFLSTHLYKFACKVLPSFLTEHETKAFGLPEENKFYSFIIYVAFMIRAFFIRHFMLPRKKFLVRTPFYPNSNGKYVPNYFVFNNMIYKDGYDISNLGPEKYAKGKVSSCPFA
ncbi:hypothetical protein RO3G_10669 [Rhizopus delemar RA 99-880]|uniref:ER-bound oxygenase mpaB/mpaB'/Rubber oxygenase catalytic domain-containing protein n=1 Tax=Rhizopus delemar (strain RA 99-880 / ATCC MYA-4621 / FGSC 9543 / NRRL 43880) TaxID=246409 RepID=I1CBX9_RHIO9|nr:hypothetical protein RO3G_10669 [Rhizopus delemar RA 99-880]|eukprot:EIE85959.1 hypothetical protein RO3G_10669 [Rhizopus delemar RA 99-880]